MSTGTLAFKIISCTPTHDNEETKHLTVGLKFKIGSEVKYSKHFHPSQTVDQILNFDLNDISTDEQVLVEAHIDPKKKHHDKTSTVHWKMPLEKFLTADWTPSSLAKADSYKIEVETKWTIKNTTQKLAGEGAANAVEKAKEATQIVHPQHTLTVHETHRPWFMRVSYYYDTTKTVYNYTTSFRVIAPVARFGENTANAILQKVTGKSLHDLDAQLLAPNLNSLDNTVDATITTVLVKLVQGQNLVLKTKDAAVSKASNVLGGTISTVGKAKDYTTSTVSSVVGSTVNTVHKATEYTTSSVKSVASSTYNTAASVTDYTTTQVVNVSSSAFGKLRGATVYVVSHVPYVGAKLRTDIA